MRARWPLRRQRKFSTPSPFFSILLWKWKFGTSPTLGWGSRFCPLPHLAQEANRRRGYSKVGIDQTHPVSASALHPVTVKTGRVRLHKNDGTKDHIDSAVHVCPLPILSSRVCHRRDGWQGSVFTFGNVAANNLTCPDMAEFIRHVGTLVLSR